jgi:hypothetical protein
MGRREENSTANDIDDGPILKEILSTDTQGLSVRVILSVLRASGGRVVITGGTRSN